jgi:DNA-directed RNA polymerase sigma subunit (sigma70/sigma32)
VLAPNSHSFNNNNLREEVSDVLEVLDEREREIIFHKYGRNGRTHKEPSDSPLFAP